MSTAPILGVSDGVFSFQVDDDNVLKGTLSGYKTLTGPTTFDLYFDVTYTGGTGIFAGSHGSGIANGFGAFETAASGVSYIEWTGNLTLVPEPGACALFLGAGISGAAFALRRRLRKK